MIKSGRGRSEGLHKPWRILMLTVVALMVLVLTACGADVRSAMVVDSNFAGERVITIDFNTSDNPLNSVEGGLSTIVELAEENMPSVLTMEVGEDSIDFTLKFSGLDDYKSKTAALLEAGDIEEAPEVEFDYADSIFARRVYFYEDIKADHLIYWLLNALEESGTVSESRGNWYEVKSRGIEIAGQEYTLGYSNSVDVGTENYLNEADVQTFYNADGSLDREIIVYADDRTYNKFAEMDSDIDQYMADLTPASASFEQKYDEERGLTSFHYSIQNSDPDGITAFTNDVLVSEQSSFEYELTADPVRLAKAKYIIRERFDHGYYIRGSNTPIRSYHNFSSPVYSLPGEDSGLNFIYSQDEDDYDQSSYPMSFFYSPQNEQLHEIGCGANADLQVQDAVIRVVSTDELEYELQLVHGENTLAEIAEISFQGLETAANDLATLAKVESDVMVISFAGNLEEIVDKIDAFLARFEPNAVIKAVTDESDEASEEASEDENSESRAADEDENNESRAADEDVGFIEIIGERSRITVESQTTSSRFTTAKEVTLHTNWSSLLSGVIPVSVEMPSAGNAYVVNAVTDIDGKIEMSDGRISLTILVVETNWIMIGAIAFVAIIFLAALILLLINLGEIKKSLAVIKEKSQAKKAAKLAAAASTSEQTAAQPAAPNTASPAAPSVAPTTPAQTEASTTPAQTEALATPTKTEAPTTSDDRSEEEDLI